MYFEAIHAHLQSETVYFCRTFTQISTQWPDTDGMREELDDLQVF